MGAAEVLASQRRVATAPARGVGASAEAPPGHLVAMAASAGGIQVVSGILAGLPISLHAAVLVVHHIDPHRRSVLPAIFARRTRLEVVEAQDGTRVREGTVYVAGPDRHLGLTPQWRIRLDQRPPQHFLRPSADALFGSVAAVAGARVIGVVLTGSGSDGAVGLQEIKASGGIVIVQEPASSAFQGMPNAAVATGLADEVLAAERIPSALCRLTGSDPA